MSIDNAPITRPIVYVIEEEEERLLLTIILTYSHMIRCRRANCYESQNKIEAEQMALLMSLEKAKPLTIYLPVWA